MYTYIIYKTLNFRDRIKIFEFHSELVHKYKAELPANQIKKHTLALY